jgi:hypothetical protein
MPSNIILPIKIFLYNYALAVKVSLSGYPVPTFSICYPGRIGNRTQTHDNRGVHSDNKANISWIA